MSKQDLSLQSAKCLKVLSKYTESEILTGIHSLSKVDQRNILRISTEINKKLVSVDISNPVVKKTVIKKRATKDQILREVIQQVISKVTEYRNTDNIDIWEINFEVGELDYENLSMNEIITKHSNLMKSSENLEKCKLLNRAQRGSLYSGLRYSETWKSQWTVFCDKVRICIKTANRHIDFFQLVKAYPGLLITGLSFETIMNVFKELAEYLDENQEIANLLKAPLRTTKITADMKIAAEDFPQTGEPPVDYLSCGADWSAGWQVSDNILSKEAAADELEHGVEEMTISNEDEGMFYNTYFIQII